MHGALWVSKTGLSAQDTQLTTISNNLANVATVGFKRDRAVFHDLMYQVQKQPGAQSAQDSQLPSGLQLGTGVRVVGTQKEHTQGNLQITDQPLDMAVNGRGFFQITLPDGTTGYTRNGQFHKDADGNVVNPLGFQLEPNIVIPQDTTSITIGRDGTVSVTQGNETEATEIGNITLVSFVNPAGLQAIGDNLFVQTNSSGDPVVGEPGLDGIGSILQGSLENSNVDTVEELVNMITTQRAYEMNSKVISTADEMLGFISQTL
ncbi:flagellar basal-body rod protein FlgG [Litoribrevibacter albus]|uniref:Flagellar basal-body rod protein FlgG n=1 Tax=Litoribrevibacter albus TaxID=1473156 RepID=A0AA37W929_9GAMM|nr:flagellar basal-body rod protein FlgG [Litoribrevibacter albus]GLQ32216.1 flagellar basal-body rod protein FlgG [Litoribrevibacter albus]